MSDYLVREWENLADKLDEIADIAEGHGRAMRLRAEYAREQARLAEANR